jgi:hypothetical protein
MATIASNAIKTARFVANGTATTFALPMPADFVNTVQVVPGGATAFTVDTYTATSAAASSSNVNFAGTPENPAVTLTFATAPAANSLIFVDYLPAGTL